MKRTAAHPNHAWSMLEKIIARVRNVFLLSRNITARITPDNRGHGNILVG
jgi:hypothetical protein